MSFTHHSGSVENEGKGHTFEVVMLLSTVAFLSVRVPQSKSATGNVINYKPNIEDILAKYSVTSPSKKVVIKHRRMEFFQYGHFFGKHSFSEIVTLLPGTANSVHPLPCSDTQPGQTQTGP